MNTNILKPEVQDWIRKHKNEILQNLAFKKSPFSQVSMQELLVQINGIKKLKNKVEWLSKTDNILYPPSLNLEQSSSWETAKYKANIFEENKEIIDLSGGFGIDSIAFAKKSLKVTHLEPNEELQNIAKHNFKTLNLPIDSQAISAEDFLKNNKKTDGFFLDPSRRDKNKNKVFLLEELSPNPLEILNKIPVFSKILIKLSPLFDLNSILEKFPSIDTIHIVAVKNEVKEILVEINQNDVKKTKIKAVNLASFHEDYIFYWEDSYKTISFGSLQRFIYEPNASIQKSQNFNHLEQKFGLQKLATNTNLWSSDELYLDFPGRIFEFTKNVNNLKKELKNKSIQIIHRNFPENINVLKKRYKFTPDGTLPLFFTSDREKNLIFWAKSIK